MPNDFNYRKHRNETSKTIAKMLAANTTAQDNGFRSVVETVKTVFAVTAVVFLTLPFRLPAADKEVAPGIFQVGMIDHPALRECSGVAPCRDRTNLFWMHSDGRRPVLYAVSRAGKSYKEYRLDIPALEDWEDIARDQEGHLFVGDLGNNNAVRQQLTVYQIDEPVLSQPESLLKARRVWELRFPKQPFDCESLFVWNQRGYVVSKVFDDAQAEIYSFPLILTNRPVTLEWVARLAITSPVTGADLSPDGKRLALAAKSGVFLFNINGNIAQAGAITPLHAKFKDKRIEGVCFVPDGLLVTAETRPIYLFTDKAFQKNKGKVKN